MTTIASLSSVKYIKSSILEARSETESIRRLAPSVEEALRSSGLCQLAVPTDAGEDRVDTCTILDICEELAGVEASVAWTVWNNTVPALHSRYMSNEVRAELFGDPRRLYAGSTRPQGQAVQAAGGYKVSGRWSLVSGCELADWLDLCCVVMNNGEPVIGPSRVPETRFAVVPKDSYHIIDTWDSIGLRGTGSHDVEVKDIFVPSDKTFSMDEPWLLDTPLHRMPIYATLAPWSGAMCLGIAQATVDAVKGIGATSVRADLGMSVREQPAVQEKVASATESLIATRLSLKDALSNAWATAVKGDKVTDEQAARLWSSGQHAANASISIVRDMFDSAGSSSLYTSSPIERAHRDIHAMCRHIIFSPLMLQEAGKVMLGMEPAIRPIFNL
jgi:indole-3-acetate monooxygenase